tara:strand:- start:3006 stop:3212 length:207 start_codon:yes stop_codon:yes gene_type:complete
VVDDLLQGQSVGDMPPRPSDRKAPATALRFDFCQPKGYLKTTFLLKKEKMSIDMDFHRAMQISSEKSS